jgi:hypothetical protein
VGVQFEKRKKISKIAQQYDKKQAKASINSINQEFQNYSVELKSKNSRTADKMPSIAVHHISVISVFFSYASRLKMLKNPSRLRSLISLVPQNSGLSSI